MFSIENFLLIDQIFYSVLLFSKMVRNKKVITRISPPAQSITSSVSRSSCTLPTAILASVDTSSFSMQGNESIKYLRLPKTIMMTCLEYVAVESMRDHETCYDYASRFTGSLKNSFSDVSTDTSWDLIDVLMRVLPGCI